MAQSVSRPRWLVRPILGLALAALAAGALDGVADGAAAGAALPPKGREVIHPGKPEEMEALAKAKPLEFLKQSLQWYTDHIEDYTCDFTRVEEIKGELQNPETMHMKFREKPFSIRLKFVTPDEGQDVTYVDGKYDGKIVVHPVGLLGVLCPTVKLSPTGDLAMKHSRRPITAGGFGNMLRLIIPQCETAQANGDLKLEYLGIRQEGGRPAYVFKRTLPQGKNYPCYVLTVYIDQQFFLPIRSDAFNWDGSLISQYRYTNLVPNPGLTNADFDPDKKF